MERAVVIFVLILNLFSLPLYAQSLANSKAAADDSTCRLEQALSGQSAPVQTTMGGAEPSWVRDPYTAYSRDRYLAARSFGSTREEAEKKALAALVSIFGLSVQSDLTAVSTYQEAATNNIITFSENSSIREVIVTAASMDSLVGAEIGYVWDNTRGTVYALAYMERSKAIAVYSEMIRINQSNIENLTALSVSGKNTLDGYARYKLAALIAGLNARYAAVIIQSGGPTDSLNMTNTGFLNIEAENIIKNITVAVNVKGDRNNRARDAFAKAISGEGLRTQGSNPPYILEINIDMSEAKFPNNNFIFCRYTLSANLIERATGSVLFPFNITDREGHTTYAEAQNRAFVSIERAISERYPDVFREYLAALLPRGKNR
jgi:hypothetical protein